MHYKFAITLGAEGRGVGITLPQHTPCFETLKTSMTELRKSFKQKLKI